ncbi:MULTISPECIES: DciA family protein [unclassified Roseitalea]|uniref:DUF721 domain-containing protein n=1 Tax=unclassified Roseitalea TaxID=2639107 RepID=UPI00273F73D8|nr:MULTISPECIES: DciA family protein [unclassified Roseitalea]
MVKPASALVNAVLDPVLAKRAGLSVALIEAWPEIAGGRLSQMSCPLKIEWPRRAPGDDDFRPGRLVVAASGAAGLHVQHQTGEIIGRVNAFMGFAAIDRVKIVQKQVAPPAEPARPNRRPLTKAERARIDALAEGFDDEALRESVRRFGRNVLAERGNSRA